MSAAVADRYDVPARQRGLDLLGQFSRHTPVLTGADLARQLDLPRASVFRILHTLEKAGFAERVGEGNSYKLSIGVLRLGFEYMASMELTEHGRSVVAALRDATGYSAHLVVRDRREVVFVVKATGRSALFHSIQVGARLPAYASPGVGSGLHLAGELFKQQAGSDLLHVPYKGTGPALNDVLGGQVPLMFSNLPGALAHIRSGKLVALGITDMVRSATAPEIATFAEQGVSGVLVTSWYGLLAPAGTPSATVERLVSDAADILGQPATREQLKAQGLTEVRMKPAEFSAHIRAETAQWARIIKARNIVAE